MYPQSMICAKLLRIMFFGVFLFVCLLIFFSLFLKKKIIFKAEKITVLHKHVFCNESYKM